MGTSQGERIRANCQIIWGKGDYDLTIESEDDSFGQRSKTTNVPTNMALH